VLVCLERRAWLDGELSDTSVALVRGLAATAIDLLKADPAQEPVTAEDMAGGVALARYALVHAQRAFDLATESPAQLLAPKIEAWVKRKGIFTFTTKECYRDLRCSGDKTTIEQALELLEATDRIDSVESVRPVKTGRLPSPSWRIKLERRAGPK
jgi:hypothetical protein